jgi:hypothetical protein
VHRTVLFTSTSVHVRPWFGTGTGAAPCRVGRRGGLCGWPSDARQAPALTPSQCGRCTSTPDISVYVCAWACVCVGVCVRGRVCAWACARGRGRLRPRSAQEFRDNRLPLDRWLRDYGVPLWRNTTDLVDTVLTGTAMEVTTLRFEDLQADTPRALVPVLKMLGTGAKGTLGGVLGGCWEVVGWGAGLLLCCGRGFGQWHADGGDKGGFAALLFGVPGVGAVVQGCNAPGQAYRARWKRGDCARAEAMAVTPPPPARPNNAGQPVENAFCIKKVNSALRSSKGKDAYPGCLYTRAQLQWLVTALEPHLSRVGYRVPAKCAAVLAGTAAGGSDASPVAAVQAVASSA